MEKAEQFTLKNADFAAVINALKEIDFGKAGVSVQGSTKDGAVHFGGSGWVARLAALESEGDTYSYLFNFTEWQNRRGVPQDLVTMNATLTAVEKMFLKLDPNAQVTTQKFKTSTKPSFF